MHLKISDMDMLHGSLAGKLLLFTLPIALSSMVQQLFNAADTAVAGHFGSANALAAVGTNTEIIALIVTVSSGLSIAEYTESQVSWRFRNRQNLIQNSQKQ